MGAIVVQNFKYGMDRRRPRMAGVPGTLWTGKNVHISRGGDIERPRKFELAYSLPAGLTKGLAAVRGQLYVFGAGAAPAMPAGVQYQRLEPVTPGYTIDQILDAKSVDGKLYVIARFSDGEIFHYYDGARVTDWDTLAATDATYTTLAAYMAELVQSDPDVTAIPSGVTVTLTANVPGVPFALTTVAADGSGTDDQVADIDTVQANVAAVSAVAATGLLTVSGGSLGATNVVTGVTVNAVALLPAPVAWVASNSATASAVATGINNGTATHGYSAEAAAGIVTISAPASVGATANGYAVAATVTGNVVVSTSAMAGGVTEVLPVAQISRVSFGGTLEPQDAFEIFVNNRGYVARVRASAMGVSVFVHKKRVWSTANSLWRYSKINTPTDWSDSNVNAGAGFLNVSSDSEGTERLVGANAYGQQAAVFSRRNIWLYDLDTDAENIAFSQQIENSGTSATRGILGYGNQDVFYLDASGIRSLRAKQYSTQAEATDAGAPMDPFIRDYLDEITDGQLQRACAVLEPRDRRFWLALGDRIFVLSSFPTSSISAWTYYEPGFAVSDFARAYNRVYARSGDFIYVYGGASGTAFPAAGEVDSLVELPFLSGKEPRQIDVSGFDAACLGSWDVYLLPDPNNENSSYHVGTVVGCTYVKGDIAMPGRSTHWAVNLSCSAAGAASICNLTLYHAGKEPEA